MNAYKFNVADLGGQNISILFPGAVQCRDEESQKEVDVPSSGIPVPKSGKVNLQFSQETQVEYKTEKRVEQSCLKIMRMLSLTFYRLKVGDSKESCLELFKKPRTVNDLLGRPTQVDVEVLSKSKDHMIVKVEGDFMPSIEKIIFLGNLMVRVSLKDNSPLSNKDIVISEFMTPQKIVEVIRFEEGSSS